VPNRIKKVAQSGIVVEDKLEDKDKDLDDKL